MVDNCMVVSESNSHHNKHYFYFSKTIHSHLLQKVANSNATMKTTETLTV